MNDRRKEFFERLCRWGNHGPSRVKWGYCQDCVRCTRLAWRRGWF